MSSPEEFDLWESLERDWIKLPIAVMKDVGPAAQTLGGVLKLTDKDTFRQTAEIAAKARLPVATVRKHLVKLGAAGWITCAGRERTRAGHLRRTATIRVPKETRSQLSPYGVLPWWACRSMPWSSRAVLSIVMGQLLTMKAVIERDDYEDDWVGEVENLGGAERFAFSLKQLQQQTGLSRESIVPAKGHLKKLKVIQWYCRQREEGGSDRDLLVPNPAFRVVVTPTGNGLVSIRFKTVRGGSDFG